MTARHLLVILAIVTAAPVAPAAASVTLISAVPVRVYDTAGVTPAITAEALAVAGRTLAPAGVDTAWKECGRDASCDRPPARGDIVLRLVLSPPSGTASAPAATLRSAAGLPLGDAYVDGGGRRGVLATIYVDRVTLLAQDAGVEPGRLLGYAIAHEIGHLLLATNAHSAAGLMRAKWSREELRRGREADWRLAAADAVAIRRRLEARRIAAF